MTARPAAFLDRDGTIIRDAAYVRNPGKIELLPDAADAIRRLNERGIPVIVVTNQSGIARGYLGLDDYELVRQRLDAMLAELGARVDATYMCPHHPGITGPCECRKPGLQLYEQAIEKFNLDASRSLFTGDRCRDVIPAIRLGGMGILLDVESTPSEDRAAALEESVTMAASLAEAVDRFLANLGAVPADSARSV